MAKTKKLDEKEQLIQYYQQLDHPLKDVIEELRTIIPASAPEIAEQVKWNSPAYYYTGDMKPFDPKEYKRDIVVLNLHKRDQVLLVFPTGAKIDDKKDILKGNFTDGRRLMTIRSMEDLQAKKKDLQNVIRECMKTIEK